MSINPFIKDIEVLESERLQQSRDLQDWKTKLAWFEEFNLDETNFQLRHSERVGAEAQTRLYQAQQAVFGPVSLVKQLKIKTAMGFDPRYWLSAERAIAKRQLMTAEQEMAVRMSKVASIETERAKAAEINRKLQGEIAIARTFDPLLARSAITGLQTNLSRIEPQLANLRLRSDDLEEILREMRESKLKFEMSRAEIMSRISRAKEFDSKLTNARTGSERRVIHGECLSRLGNGSPGEVLAQNQSALRGVDDSIKKLQARIDKCIRFAQLDIQHIVIDGNNLCYQQNRFIGLVALEALVPKLAQRYSVSLIFDSGVRRMLGLKNRDIEARFPQAERVHIVAPGQKADETVLLVGSDDSCTFVLSNDRFVDYPEIMAVKDGRLLRHEIVGQTVYIHDLQIAVMFNNPPDASVA